jgi:hypothetical protein
MSDWVDRVRRQSETAPVQEVQNAARNLAEQAGIAPGKIRVVFQTVADVALVGTVVISGALAAVHLYRTIFPRHKEDHPAPEPTGGDHLPPRRRGRHATAAAEDRGGYENDGYRSR